MTTEQNELLLQLISLEMQVKGDIEDAVEMLNDKRELLKEMLKLHKELWPSQDGKDKKLVVVSSVNFEGDDEYYLVHHPFSRQLNSMGNLVRAIAELKTICQSHLLIDYEKSNLPARAQQPYSFS